MSGGQMSDYSTPSPPVLKRLFTNHNYTVDSVEFRDTSYHHVSCKKAPNAGCTTYLSVCVFRWAFISDITKAFRNTHTIKYEVHLT